MATRRSRAASSVRFDSKGRVVITDKKLYRAIATRLIRGKQVRLRLPELSSVDTPAAAISPGELRISLFRLGCTNTMCDCPVTTPKKARDIAKKARKLGIR